MEIYVFLTTISCDRTMSAKGFYASEIDTSYIFNELDKVNSLRNRIAHHEPICFRLHASEIDTSYIVNEYQKIQTLFSWIGIDSRSMLYGLDHVQSVCAKINSLKG